MFAFYHHGPLRQGSAKTYASARIRNPYPRFSPLMNIGVPFWNQDLGPLTPQPGMALMARTWGRPCCQKNTSTTE